MKPWYGPVSYCCGVVMSCRGKVKYSHTSCWWSNVQQNIASYTDLDENRGMLEAVGVTVDELLDLEQRVDKVIADTRQFTITEELYN